MPESIEEEFSLYRLGNVLPDSMKLNQELVKQGWYLWYRKYALGDAVPEGFEHEAREVRNGLWADPRPILPWEGRKRSR